MWHKSGGPLPKGQACEALPHSHNVGYSKIAQHVVPHWSAIKDIGGFDVFVNNSEEVHDSHAVLQSGDYRGVHWFRQWLAQLHAELHVISKAKQVEPIRSKYRGAHSKHRADLGHCKLK